MREFEYDRKKATDYAKEWALKRNRRYLDFENIGGDCTNFASQCIYAGCGVMNYIKTFGWYYNSPEDRAPAWTGVQHLYNFLINNKGVGPYAEETDLDYAEPGDIIQLGNTQGEFYHSPVVVEVRNGRIYVAAHTFDAYMRPLSSYIYDGVRVLHIIGARTWN
ncbi:MAG: amidase domain-containing protein [Oscillospiraceae bacterium]